MAISVNSKCLKNIRDIWRLTVQNLEMEDDQELPPGWMLEESSSMEASTKDLESLTFAQR